MRRRLIFPRGEQVYALLAFVALCLFAVAGWQFAVFDGLSSFADDSVSYLLMGLAWSPWLEAGEVVRVAAGAERYPPLFPALLAVSGAAHSLVAAHALVLATALAALVALYRLAGRQLGSPGLGLMLMLAVAASPAVWFYLQRILSENLYLLLSLLLVAGYPRLLKTGRHGAGAWLFGLLLGALILTRSIGLSLLLGLLASQAMHWRRSGQRPAWQAPLGAVLVVAVYYLAREGGGDPYMVRLDRLVEDSSGGNIPGQAVLAALLPQLSVMLDAWLQSWAVFWQVGPNARYGLLVGLVVLMLAGLLLRARDGRLDAWYSLFYLGILVVWPYPGQMARFIAPIAPFLLLAALHPLVLLARRGGYLRLLPHAALALLLAVVLPSAGFFYHRAMAGTPAEARISEFYRGLDLPAAQQAAAGQRLMFDDLRRMREETPEGTRIMWYTPSYVALLAERHGVATPDLQAAAELGARLALNRVDYVYLSHMSPRHTAKRRDLRAEARYLRDWSRPVWQRNGPDGEPLSVFLAVDRAALWRSVLPGKAQHMLTEPVLR